MVRADSAFYGSDVIAAIGRAKARFSITARQDVAVKRAIAGIGEDAWTTIRYPHAVFDDQLGQWVSDAEVAEVPFTAFASRGKNKAVTARLIDLDLTVEEVPTRGLRSDAEVGRVRTSLIGQVNL